MQTQTQQQKAILVYGFGKIFRNPFILSCMNEEPET